MRNNSEARTALTRLSEVVDTLIPEGTKCGALARANGKHRKHRGERNAERSSGLILSVCRSSSLGRVTLHGLAQSICKSMTLSCPPPWQSQVSL